MKNIFTFDIPIRSSYRVSLNELGCFIPFHLRQALNLLRSGACTDGHNQSTQRIAPLINCQTPQLTGGHPHGPTSNANLLDQVAVLVGHEGNHLRKGDNNHPCH